MPSRVPLKIFVFGLIVVTIRTAEIQNILRIPKRGEKAQPAVLNEPELNPHLEPKLKPKLEKTLPTFNEKHLITVLYEALCPVSERFMAQLGPVYESLKDYLEIKFVPFGLTKLFCREKINGKCQHPIFTCKHGPTACYANRQHDCALQYSESPEKQVNFIRCTMGEHKVPIEKCLILLGYSLYDIDICMIFEEGTELQLKSYETTVSWSFQNLPLILVDNNSFTEYQEMAKEDFRIFICNILVNKYRHFDVTNAPMICRTSDVFPNL